MSDSIDPVAAEIAAQDVEATLAKVAGRWVLTMKRDLNPLPGRIWAMLTEPGELRRWSPIGPDRPLTEVGPATSRENPEDAPVELEVLQVDAPNELVHRWGGHLLRWTLRPTDFGTQLTLEHTFDEWGESGMYGAGWHICLAVLTCLTEGLQVARVVGNRAYDYGWLKIKEEYESRLPQTGDF